MLTVALAEQLDVKDKLPLFHPRYEVLMMYFVLSCKRVSKVELCFIVECYRLVQNAKV